MLKRWVPYFAFALAAIPAVVWLAFGPGVEKPYAMFTWPARRLVSHLSPSAGTSPSADVLGEALVSAVIWFLVVVIIDFVVVNGRHHRSAG